MDLYFAHVISDYWLANCMTRWIYLKISSTYKTPKTMDLYFAHVISDY